MCPFTFLSRIVFVRLLQVFLLNVDALIHDLGQFAFNSGRNEPCLVYVTFHDEIFVYHNITMKSIYPAVLQ